MPVAVAELLWTRTSLLKSMNYPTITAAMPISGGHALREQGCRWGEPVFAAFSFLIRIIRISRIDLRTPESVVVGTDPPPGTAQANLEPLCRADS